MSDEAKPVAMTCAEVQPLLADWPDVLRGEIPPVGVSPLAESACRDGVEAHLNACAACRAEARELSEVGLAFAEFDVGERPAQDFERYALAVRARMSSDEKLIPLPRRGSTPARERQAPGWLSWLGLAGASAAAAVLAVMASAQLFPAAQPVPLVIQQEAAAEVGESEILKSFKDLKPLPRQQTLRPLTVNPVETVTFGLRSQAVGEQVVNLGRDATDTVKYLNQTLEREGTVLFLEKTPEGTPQRLGAVLAVSKDEKANPEGCQNGLAVFEVLPGGPAYQAGVRKGHYILAINGMRFEKSTLPEAIKFINALHQLAIGEHIQVDYAEFIGSDWVIRRGETAVGVTKR